MDELRGGGIIEGESEGGCRDTGREKFSTERDGRGGDLGVKKDVGDLGLGPPGDDGGLRVKRDCESGASIERRSSFGTSL